MSAITPIYTLTAYTPNGYHPRVFGYYHKLKDAREAADRNYGSMHESRHEWLVIEEVREGILATGLVISWFRWDDKQTEWIVCAAPTWSIGIVNFSIG